MPQLALPCAIARENPNDYIFFLSALVRGTRTNLTLRLNNTSTDEFFKCKVVNCCMEFSQQRKSHTSIGEIYFWTATINKWMQLLESDSNKQLMVDYLKKLSDEGLISVYAFVIMPNHIHLTCLPAGRYGNKTN